MLPTNTEQSLKLWRSAVCPFQFCSVLTWQDLAECSGLILTATVWASGFVRQWDGQEFPRWAGPGGGTESCKGRNLNEVQGVKPKWRFQTRLGHIFLMGWLLAHLAFIGPTSCNILLSQGYLKGTTWLWTTFWGPARTGTVLLYRLLLAVQRVK